ncbi:MAG: ABC transporter substrate-binding protein [Clostridia bacterium]|nr:ABC transporter substrate-binding protein [Clostridia bacterium]
MKNFKKISTLLLAVLMIASCVVLSSCGNEKKADDVLVIGGVGPLTGDYANYGNSVKNGAEIAVAEINAAGGINGFTIRLDFQDSAGVPDSAVAAYGKLMDDDMMVSLGGVLSGETASIVAAAKDDGILILTPSASADDALKGNDAAFRVCFSDSSQGVSAANYIGANNLPKKVAVFYQNDIDYSSGLYKAFEDTADANGIEIVVVESFTSDTDTDFTTQITAIQNSGAEMIFMPIYADEASTFLSQANGKFAEDMLFFGCDGLDGIIGKVADTADCENVLLLTPFAADAEAENVQKFVTAYKNAHNDAIPDQFAADGYDAIYAIKAAMEKANITVEDQDNFNSRIVAAMTEITVNGVTGNMTWEASGETAKDPIVMIIKSGVAQLYNP